GIEVPGELKIPIGEPMPYVPGRQEDSQRPPDVLPSRMVHRDIASGGDLSHELHSSLKARELIFAEDLDSLLAGILGKRGCDPFPVDQVCVENRFEYRFVDWLRQTWRRVSRVGTQSSLV